MLLYYRSISSGIMCNFEKKKKNKDSLRIGLIIASVIRYNVHRYCLSTRYYLSLRTQLFYECRYIVKFTVLSLPFYSSQRKFYYEPLSIVSSLPSRNYILQLMLFTVAIVICNYRSYILCTFNFKRIYVQ